MVPLCSPSNDAVDGSFAEKATGEEGADPVKHILDGDKSYEKPHNPGKDGHPQIADNPVEIISPVETQVSGPEYDHCAGNK